MTCCDRLADRGSGGLDKKTEFRERNQILWKEVLNFDVIGVMSKQVCLGPL